tara:strand:+ start:460 stop:708 length:249 start_codon:yes stop_codon:yes gene_type:complete
MVLKPPHYKKDAIPTPRGWVHPITGELLVARKISTDDINEYMDVEEKLKVQVLKEAPTTVEEAEDELIDTLPSEYEEEKEED